MKYYHVVMRGSKWAIVESEHKECKKVAFSVNSYVKRERAEANINDSKSRYFKVIKKVWHVI